MLFVLRFALGDLTRQQTGWQPSPGLNPVPIWPTLVPDSGPLPGAETEQTETKEPVAARPWVYVTNISRPTITVYSPKGTNTGAAVVVFPGGGCQILAIDLEGTEVCDWLTFRGITGVLFEYRLPGSGTHWDAQSRCQVSPKAPTALEDAQRTLGLVHLHAAEWHIDPTSACITTSVCLQKWTWLTKKVVVLILRELSTQGIFGSLRKFTLNSDIRVTADTPPTFLVEAEDDNVDDVNHSRVYYIALKNAGVPAEMHLPAQGRHAFGLRRTTFPVTAWPRFGRDMARNDRNDF